MEVMSYQYWMKHTAGGTFTVRSGLLRTVDAALAKYDKTKSPGDLELVKKSLLAWMQDKGSDWKSSIRNKFHAVDDLYRQVTGLPVLAKTGEEMLALSHVQMEQAALLDKLFLMQTLDFRAGIFGKLLGGNSGIGQKVLLKTKVLGAGENIRVLAKSGQTAQQASSGIFSTMLEPIAVGLRDEVKNLVLEAMPGFMATLAAEAAPFLGLITSGGSAAIGYATLARAQYRVDQSEMHARRMLVLDNPEKALAAITLLFQRERNNEAIKASINTASFGAKAAGVFLDLGTATNAAVGLAASIAKLANAVRIIWRDVEERKEANELMKRPITPDIFKAAPVVGAYYVCCAPTSVLVNSIFTRWWKHGVRGEIERSVAKHVTPMRESARDLIHIDRFMIKALQNYPGVVVRNEKALEVMEKRMKNSRMDNMSYDRIEP